MPRIARVVLPSYSHHIIQRGHNRQPVFLSEEDYLYFLENLKEWIAKSILEGEWELIRQAVQRGQLAGGGSFKRVEGTLVQKMHTVQISIRAQIGVGAEKYLTLNIIKD